MLSFENIIQKAVQEVDLPGAVVVGSDASGQTYFANAFGVRSLEKGKEEPMSLDAVFWLASSTKLMTVIAALQCVERGRFTLDEDVTRLLPELKDIDILTGFEEGTEEPILVRSKKTITLRYTHLFIEPDYSVPVQLFEPKAFIGVYFLLSIVVLPPGLILNSKTNLLTRSSTDTYLPIPRAFLMMFSTP
ncbi:beta-lactamase [Phlyctema vagabunda]|uniref:Beta-lactamase n=1 Tax=Phlyctema vagabunda TaxID=108571 RepID=A0ABR4P6D7_9HELO